MLFNKKLTESDFHKRILELDSVPSITGNTIYDFTLKGDILEIFRRSTQEIYKIKMRELYEFYINEVDYKTATAKKYISGRVQSPATAVLLALAWDRSARR